MKLKDKILRFAVRHSDTLSQALHKKPLDAPQRDAEMSRLCRQAAAEGIVLLKNEGVLPLDAREETAFFGRNQYDYFYVGYGSGGDVNATYLESPMAAVRSRGDLRYNKELADTYQAWSEANVPFEGVWGMWPTCFDEMPLTEEQVRKAAQTSKRAVVFIGRAMGESMDNQLKPGYYYLNDEEKQLLDRVTAAFSRVVVVIDAGNVIDLSWVAGYGDKIGALVYAWQGGMESGNALIDVLYGDVNPSGKLTDTIARDHRDYPGSADFGNSHFNNYTEDIYVGYRYFETFAPEKVLYPFGFGLSYTTFAVAAEGRREAQGSLLEITVTNTGNRAGAEVVQIYCAQPQGKLGKATRNLVAFAKTDVLRPGERQTLTVRVEDAELASFDDSGATGNRSCYVLEAGEYTLLAGTDVRRAEQVLTWNLSELIVTERLTTQAGPVTDFKRMKPVLRDGRLVPEYQAVPRGDRDLKGDILTHLPEAVPMTGDRGISFGDVCAGKASLDDFVAQLDITDLDAITRGEGKMNSPQGVAGNAGILGGTTEALRAKGVPVITTTDGPSGIRISYHSSLLPCGTALACSWNPGLLEKLGAAFGKEMARRGSDILLGPGLNIHRDPLCGRNFEYFSEDPYVSGKMAAAMVRGIQSVPGRSACPKHFACNNQEWNRVRHDSRLSERALREIYLRGFEICVKESEPLTLMTAYNKINGVWCYYRYDLATNILRGEWGYEGLVITDWWMRPCKDPNFPGVANNAYRVRAQVDVLMPGGKVQGLPGTDTSTIRSFRRKDGITLGELQRSAKNVLKLCMRLKGQ